MKIWSFRFNKDDLAGAAYSKGLDYLLAMQASFMLVLRDQLEFDVSAGQILHELGRFKRSFTRSTCWPGTEIHWPAGNARIHFFHCDPKAKVILREPGSLFGWRASRYPEDLAFFDENGNCTLSTVSHERQGWILSKEVASHLGQIVPLEIQEVSDSDFELIRCSKIRG